ncbi:MAG: hypothetical protein KJ811_04365, partial [Candidatus Margulisbacteria bacterium]|nr:hypothetical protein [Candidatus Margulisiibacteriota bacterium]
PKKKAQKIIAKVDHFFDKISVAAFKLQAPMKVGDEIWFKGAHADFVQTIESIQMNHHSVERAKKGQEVGIKVCQKVNEGVVLLPAKLRLKQMVVPRSTFVAQPIMPQAKTQATTKPPAQRRIIPQAKPASSDPYGGKKFFSF